MSKSTKRKHVVKELLQTEYNFPNESQKIVKLCAGRGNNLHSVESDDGAEFLVSMPSKFRKNVWVKRGDFVIVDMIPEGDKVRGEISTILDDSYIKFLKNNDRWPKAFDVGSSPNSSPEIVNNRPNFCETDSDSSDSD